MTGSGRGRDRTGTGEGVLRGQPRLASRRRLGPVPVRRRRRHDPALGRRHGFTGAGHGLAGRRSAGWPDDAPTLDLERYLPSADEQRVILYGPLVTWTGPCNVADPSATTSCGCPVGPSRKSPAAGQAPAAGGGRAIRRCCRRDHGPDPGRWPTCSRRGSRQGAGDRSGSPGRLQRVLLTYPGAGYRPFSPCNLHLGRTGLCGCRRAVGARRPGNHKRREPGPPPPPLASEGPIFGLGAIGSVVADLLHRSGVGELCLVDPDLVLPGNTTRHLVGEPAVGSPRPAQSPTTWPPPARVKGR